MILETEIASWMRRCEALAEQARVQGEAGVGCVIVRDGALVAEACEEACCWYQSSTMVYNVVKKVSVGIFIKRYLGKRMLGNTAAEPSVPFHYSQFFAPNRAISFHIKRD